MIAGTLCSAPDIPVPSKGDCQVAAKTLGDNFRGTITPGTMLDFAFAQKGCIKCEPKACFTENFTENFSSWFEVLNYAGTKTCHFTALIVDPRPHNKVQCSEVKCSVV